MGGAEHPARGAGDQPEVPMEVVEVLIERPEDRLRPEGRAERAAARGDDDQDRLRRGPRALARVAEGLRPAIEGRLASSMRREVELGIEGNEGFEVVKGLKEGEEVVTAEIDLAQLRETERKMKEVAEGGGLTAGGGGNAPRRGATTTPARGGGAGGGGRGR